MTEKNSIYSTPKYEIRTWKPSEDYLKFFEMICDVGYQQFSINDGSFPKLDECEEILEKVKERFQRDGMGVLGIFTKDKQELIGTTALYAIVDTNKIELSIRLISDFQGKGLGKELVKATLNYATKDLGLEKVYAVIDPQNIRSVKIFEEFKFNRLGNIQYIGQDMLLYVFEE